MSALSLKVNPDPQITHAVLLGAPGVKKAAQAVRVATTAAAEERKKRQAAHREWYRQLRSRKGDTAALPPDDDLTPAEVEQFRRDLKAAQWRLAAAVDAAGDDIIDAARLREEEILEETRRLVAQLDERAGELKRLAQAVNVVAAARSRAGCKVPPLRVADLVYLAGKSDPAVIDFGDGRTLWLNVSGRA
ncbi:hypothetical protein [Cellulomonas iranensis]|uniref:Uncharacterized protein n=1 Tax=Cellulomonas iranensis TaxID=76862 RepID=A0ABU0GFZ0_9CELL|nr:hypothetical protein [Cellulomonas iranensis]MDQ0424278.1 hypothetical protein [Cellulomonas iranensis]